MLRLRRRPGQVRAAPQVHAHLLLLFDERLAPLPPLPDEERLLLPLAPARSLCALLFWVLALPPLLVACERLIVPEDDADADGDDLEDDGEEEEELRDAMACSFGAVEITSRVSRGFPSTGPL
jgi:hypothetical protein